MTPAVVVWERGAARPAAQYGNGPTQPPVEGANTRPLSQMGVSLRLTADLQGESAFCNWRGAIRDCKSSRAKTSLMHNGSTPPVEVEGGESLSQTRAGELLQPSSGGPNQLERNGRPVARPAVASTGRCHVGTTCSVRALEPAVSSGAAPMCGSTPAERTGRFAGQTSHDEGA
jgi:hypothetical protein